MLRAITLGVLCAAMLLGACAAHAEDTVVDPLGGMIDRVKAKKPYRIGWAVVHLTGDFWRGVAYGVVDEADYAGVEVERILSAGGYGKVDVQLGQLDTLAALGLDAILVSGTSFDGFNRAIQNITAKGTKVIGVGPAVNSPDISVGIIADEIAVGATMADFVCARATKGTIAAIPGPAGTEWNRRQFDGFEKRIAEKCPGMTIEGAEYRLGMTLEDGQAQASELLIKHPDASFIYTAGAELGNGAANVVKRMGVPAEVLSATVGKNTVAAIKDGRIGMTTTYSSILYGRAAVQYAVHLLNGDPLPEAVEGVLPYPAAYVPVFMLTKDNVDSFDLYIVDMPPEGWSIPALQ